MADTLFTAFVMTDRIPAAAQPQARKATAMQQTDTVSRAATGKKTRKAFVEALAEALRKTMPHKVAFSSGAPIDVTALAEAMADMLAGRSVLLRLRPDAADHRRPAIRAFLEAMVKIAGTLPESRQEAAIARLAEVILPDDLGDARGALAADNLELRDRFMAETAPLTSLEVAARAGHRSRNPYATAAQWKRRGAVFSVRHRGAEYFPAFQFCDGRPHPTIGKTLTALPDSLSPWQRALWFVSTNGWLGNTAPKDRLDDPAAVVAAAQRESQEVIG